MSAERVREILKEIRVYLPNPVTMSGDRVMAAPLGLDIGRQVPEPPGVPLNPRLDYDLDPTGTYDPSHLRDLIKGLKSYMQPGSPTAAGVQAIKMVGGGL